ncbi:unnamed protein product [Gadus morhua 'NCC']
MRTPVNWKHIGQRKLKKTELSPQILWNLHRCTVESILTQCFKAHSSLEMYQQQSYSWEEDDFQLPYGVEKCGHKQPNCDRTYVMYHGTTRTNATAIQRNGFKQSAGGMLGCGVYLSRDLQKASRYPIDPALPDSERVVFRVKVNVGNVIAINRQQPSSPEELARLPVRGGLRHCLVPPGLRHDEERLGGGLRLGPKPHQDRQVYRSNPGPLNARAYRG